MNTLRWGILSTARIGDEKVIPGIAGAIGSEIVAIGSRDEQRARAVAERHAIDLAGMTVETTKEMTSSPPRRIASLPTRITIPLPADHPLLGLDQVILTPHLGASTEEAQENVAIDVAEQIRDIESHGERLAAFVVDSMFSSDGVFSEPTELLAPVIDLVHKAGGVFVADEVQCGFARSGEALWGYQRHGIDPDIATMGKPMGNGYPVAGIAVRHHLVEKFGTEPQKRRWLPKLASGEIRGGLALTEEYAQALETLVLDAGIGLVVLDSYTSAVRGDRNESSIADMAWRCYSCIVATSLLCCSFIAAILMFSSLRSDSYFS